MPPARFLPNTKTFAPGDLTDAQYKALDGLKQTTPALKKGAARPEFVNKVLLADGTLSDNLDAVRAAALTQARNEPGNIDELEAEIATGFRLLIVDCDLVPRAYFQCAVPGNPDVELV